MKDKYIILFVIGGATNEMRFPKERKAEAIAAFKNIRLRADRIKLSSIDSEDPEIWYDLSKKY